MEQTLLDKPLSRFLSLDWEKALYILIIILAIATRLGGLGDRVQSHDESLHTKYSWDLYTGRGYSHSPMMHGPFLFHVTALSYYLFDDNDFTARLPIALMGIALVAFPWLLRHWLGRAGALVTSFFLLISPSIAYYSRYIRHDIPIMLWALIILWAVFSYLRDGRERWLYLMAAAISLTFATKEVAFIYNAIFGVFLVIMFAIQALKREWANNLKPLFLAALAITLVGGMVLGLGVRARPPDQPDLEANQTELEPDQPKLATWAIVGGILAGAALLAAAIILLTATWQDLRTDSPNPPYRVFDLIIILGTLCLPFLLPPVLIKGVGLEPTDYTWITSIFASGLPITHYYPLIIVTGVLLLSAAIGLFWDFKRWSIAAAIHYVIFAILFTTIFTNVSGIASGMVGSLGYWLAQQEVERGGQPWYYYLLMVPLYEYLPLLLALIAPIYFIIRRKALASRFSFILFLLWWIALAWIGYSYAGEKMPWLTVHLALPMILLSGQLVGQFIENVDWQHVREQKVWLLALIAPPFIAAVVMLIKAILAGPFLGLDLVQLDTTGLLLGGLAGTLAFGMGLAYAVYHGGWRTSARVLLLVVLLLPVFLTIRTTWRFCYVNYDYPIEFLVYAHAGQDVKETMNQIDELSRRTAGGPNLIQVAYGADGSWPFHWYMRDYPNAIFYGGSPSRENMQSPIVIAGREEWDDVAPYMDRDYIVNTYTFLWWPMEDYRNLTLPRVTHAITDTQTRAALWDIWYDRDYRLYDQVTGKRHTLDAWPLHNEYRVYIRRDVAAQVWDLGATVGPTEAISTDPYATGWQDLAARMVFGSQGSEPGQFERPSGITIDSDGFVYVADTGNHRVQKFDGDGRFVAAWGENSTVETEMGIVEGFNEPWGVAVAPDASLYVADTWNHRVQKLDALGNPITAWGTFGQFGPGDIAGRSVFFGPRAVAIDPDGRVYVTDTGNKRVQVFDANGEFVSQWGGGGVLDGYLDEPVGIAIGPDGNFYVADTWNRRVQVFDANGQYLWQWPITGWDFNQIDEKPFLAVDDQGYVYVTDPYYFRVLVFDRLGNYKLSFGQYGLDERSFALPTGIAVAEDGSIYVVDSHGARVLVFDPLDLD